MGRKVGRNKGKEEAGGGEKQINTKKICQLQYLEQKSTFWHVNKSATNAYKWRNIQAGIKFLIPVLILDQQNIYLIFRWECFKKRMKFLNSDITFTTFN